MTDTELDRIDAEIALGRRQYLAAYFDGAELDAIEYAHHVDELLDERNRLVRGPFTVDGDTLPNISRKD